MINKTLKIAVIGLMAALAYVSFTFLQIKIPTPGGTTSFHLGNTFVVLAALLIGGVPGGIAGAIGMGIGDLLDPVYVTYAPKTIILKLMIGVVTGLVAHKIFKIKNLDGKKLYFAVVISAIAGLVFNVVGEPLFGYFYNSVILGAPEKAALTLAGWNAITTTTNAILSVIISSILYIAIQPILKRSGIIEKLAPKY
ncbi:MAG: ECF transporter S component [Faecalibacillus sp.]